MKVVIESDLWSKIEREAVLLELEILWAFVESGDAKLIKKALALKAERERIESKGRKH